MFGLPSLYVKLIGGAVALALLVGLVLVLKHYKSLADSRGQTIATICSVTRTAAGQPKLKCGEVPKQIQFMGEAIGTLTRELHTQNDAVAKLGADTKQQAAELAEAKRQADKRGEKPQATSRRLSDSAKSPDRQARPCEPSKALQETWR